MVARGRSGDVDRMAHLVQRASRVPLVARQFLDQEHQDIKLAHLAESASNFAETSGEPSAIFGIDAQEWHELAKSSRGHAGFVQRSYVTFVDVFGRLSKCLQTSLERGVLSDRG